MAAFQPGPESPSTPEATLSFSLAARSPGRLIEWVTAHSFSPAWLPARWRTPAVAYPLAAVLVVGTALTTALLRDLSPSFPYPGVFTLLAILLVALQWGAGPALVASLLAPVLETYLLFGPHFGWNLADVGYLGATVLYVGAAGLISVVASRERAWRLRAWGLAESLRQAAQEATARANQLEAILDAIPDSIGLHDVQGRMVRLNLAGQRALGGDQHGESLREIPRVYGVYRLSGELIPAEDLPVARVLGGEPMATEELLMRYQDGGDQYRLARAAPWFDGQGRLGGVVTVTHDVTALRQAERAAAEHSSQLDAIFEAMADGVFLFGRAGEILQLNGAARELFGMDGPLAAYAAPLGERGYHTLVRDAQRTPLPEGEWPLFRVLRGEVLKGEQAADLLVRARDGREWALNVTGAPVRDAAGAISGAVCVVRDVTERRRLEAQIVAERNRLQQVLDVLPEGILIADAHPPTVMTINRAAEELLGVNVVGQPVPIPPPGVQGEGATRHPDGTPYPVDELPLERALLRGEVVRGDQFLLRNAATEREIAILANSAPLRDEGGSINGAVTVFQDITAIKDLERQREEFLATVSHDLKNPLTGILGMSQMLRRQVGRIEEAERARFGEGLDAIARTARQMATQINELLDLTHIQMGRPLQLEPAPTDVTALLRAVVDEYQQTTERHTLCLKHEEDGVVSLVDALRLRRAVANLLANAIKYSPKGGAIRTSLTTTEDHNGSWLTISVTDGGVGIPAAEVDQVFEGFYRASNVTGHFTGTGLGLTGVRQVVEQHGGVVALESTMGVGTTVTIRLPLRRPPMAEAP